jgi:hypothetical protein
MRIRSIDAETDTDEDFRRTEEVAGAPQLENGGKRISRVQLQSGQEKSLHVHVGWTARYKMLLGKEKHCRSSTAPNPKRGYEITCLRDRHEPASCFQS